MSEEQRMPPPQAAAANGPGPAPPPGAAPVTGPGPVPQVPPAPYTGAAAPADVLPAPVARAAAAAGLGAYHGRRGWGDPWAKAGQGLLLVLAAVAGEVLIRVLGILFLLNVPLLLMFAGGVSNAVAALARGRQDNHLFEGGLVHDRKGALTVVTWPQVERLGRSSGNRGLTGGRRFPLRLADGRAIAIPLVQADGRDRFIEQLVALLKRNGRPVE